MVTLTLYMKNSEPYVIDMGTLEMELQTKP